MSILPKRLKARVKDNPNLRVTKRTQTHLGAGAVSTENIVEARLYTTCGNGDSGSGTSSFIWRGEYNPINTYTKGNVVLFNGATYIYVSDTTGSSEIPSSDSTVWDIFSGEPEMRVEIDELPDGNIYVGKALPGTQTTENKWAIKLVKFINNDISIVWADGESSYNKTWDSRDTYTYL